MKTEPPTTQVEFAPELERQLRILYKRYRQIRSDVQTVVEQLQIGGLPGDRLSCSSFKLGKVKTSKPYTESITANRVTQSKRMSAYQC